MAKVAGHRFVGAFYSKAAEGRTKIRKGLHYRLHPERADDTGPQRCAGVWFAPTLRAQNSARCSAAARRDRTK